MNPRNLGRFFYYDLLDTKAKCLYEKIDQLIGGGTYCGSIRCHVHEVPEADTAFSALRALRNDRPEYFFLGFETTYAPDKTDKRYVYVRFPILYAETIDRIKAVLNREIVQLVRGTGDQPLIERERIIYTRIAKRMTYHNTDDVKDHTIVGPVLYEQGVCEGINALLMLVLRRAGIPCIKILGHTKTGGAHCWTIAWINEQPVHLDVTWDLEKPGKVILYNHFNLSNRQIGMNHFGFDKENIPICTFEGAEYYRYHGLNVSSFQELCTKLKVLHRKNAALVHFIYTPADYSVEIRRALTQNNITSTCWLLINEQKKNVSIRHA